MRPTFEVESPECQSKKIATSFCGFLRWHSGLLLYARSQSEATGMISEKLSKEFQLVVQEELGIELSFADAQLCLTDWTNFLSTLAEIQSREEPPTN